MHAYQKATTEQLKADRVRLERILDERNRLHGVRPLALVLPILDKKKVVK